MHRRYLTLCLAHLFCLACALCAVAQPPVPSPVLPVSHFDDAGAVRGDGPVVRERTELVTLNVTVTDRANKPVAGLKREQFEVFEDRVRQEIEFFCEADAPASVAVVFDVSASMGGKLEYARDALHAFIETSHPDDEYYLIAFNERPVLHAAAADGDALVRAVGGLRPTGQTALYDAVYLGLDALNQARHAKRALLVISDGAENHSHYSFRDLRRAIKESDARIYCLGAADLSGASCGRVCQMTAQVILAEMARLTGGRAFFPTNFGELEQITTSIAVELRRQYSIGYLPTGGARDGRWRRIQLRIRPEGEGRLVVRARAGYYALP